MKTLAVLVGGGPSPGINAVIAAATIEARNRGVRVVGCLEGFRPLVNRDPTQVRELDIDDVSRIHFDGGSILRTARVNPAASEESLRHVVETLQQLEVSYLLTIGGDDTASGAARVSRAFPGGLGVVHVPKTIDNDLPLPADVPTFGFTTAVNVGKDIVRNLMADAAATGKWFLVNVMGRHAGHLAMGIGAGAGATLTVIGEELPAPPVSIHLPADIIEGAIIKRLADRRDHGVALVAEGIAEKLDLATLGEVERDPYGNVMLAEVDLARLLKARITASLRARGLTTGIVPKNLGFELRCAPPGAFDIQYCRSLGYWGARLLLDGRTGVMATIQAGRVVPVPFAELMDPDTGRIRVRYLDVESEWYQTQYAYMIRLKPDDFAGPDRIRALAEAGRLSESDFVARFEYLVRERKGFAWPA
ncbi:MAG: 6-phosphofructokinase [Candidatus Rokuibacteriota bacterium]